MLHQRGEVKCSWEDRFGEILEKLNKPETAIKKIKISTNEWPIIHRIGHHLIKALYFIAISSSP